jgi:uncharacterized protein (TIGR02391 family)
MEINFPELKGAYQRLVRLSEVFSPKDVNVVDRTLGLDFNKIILKITQLTGENFDDFLIPPDFQGYDKEYCSAEVLMAKLKQALGYLEGKYNLNDRVIVAGSLASSIKDAELKARCLDIIASPGPYDRAINQATQILEDRIKNKSGITDLIGEELINKVFKDKPEESVLIVKAGREEHSGFSHLCRGVIRAFRNPTHHKLSDDFAQEDALKFCGFIDILLNIVDSSKKQSK